MWYVQSCNVDDPILEPTGGKKRGKAGKADDEGVWSKQRRLVPVSRTGMSAGSCGLQKTGNTKEQTQGGRE
jgi:hypothetical protein